VTKQFAEDEWEQPETVVPILVFIKVRIEDRRSHFRINSGSSWKVGGL